MKQLITFLISLLFLVACNKEPHYADHLPFGGLNGEPSMLMEEIYAAVEDSTGGYRLDTLEKKDAYFFDEAGDRIKIVAYDIKSDSVSSVSESTFENYKETAVKMIFYSYEKGTPVVDTLESVLKERTEYKEEWDLWANGKPYNSVHIEISRKDGFVTKIFNLPWQTNTTTADSLYRVVEIKQVDMDGNIQNHKYLSYLPNSNYLDQINDVYVNKKKIDRITTYEAAEIDGKGNVTLRKGYRNGKLATVTVCTIVYP